MPLAYSPRTDGVSFLDKVAARAGLPPLKKNPMFWNSQLGRSFFQR